MLLSSVGDLCGKSESKDPEEGPGSSLSRLEKRSKSIGYLWMMIHRYCLSDFTSNGLFLEEVEVEVEVEIKFGDEDSGPADSAKSVPAPALEPLKFGYLFLT